MTKILGVCASLAAKSGNRTLIERAAQLAPEGVTFEIFEGLAALPHFNPDLEHVPNEAVAAWRSALTRSDAVLIACPEYGHSLPGVLKNAVDWVIGTGELERKVVAITASTHGADRGRMGLAALRQTLLAVSAEIVGGAPIARGPESDAMLIALLADLTEVAQRYRA